MSKENAIFKLSIMDRIFVICGILAAAFLLVAVLVAGRFQPSYSHVSQAISELGARGASRAFILNYFGLVPTGIFTLIFSLAMFRQLKGSTALNISSSLVVIVGIARLFAGIFPCDPGCYPIETISGRVHAISGMLALFAGSLAPLLMAKGLKKKQSQVLYLLSIMLGVISFILFLALISKTWLVYFGLIQRLLLILTYTWIVAVAIQILQSRIPKMQ